MRATPFFHPVAVCFTGLKIKDRLLYGGGNRRGPGRKAEAVEYLSYRVRRIDCAEDAHAAPALASQYVPLEYTFEELSPAVIPWMTALRLSAVLTGPFIFRAIRGPGFHRGKRHYLRSPS